MLTVPSVHHFSSLLVVRMDLPVIGAPQSSSGFPRGNFEGPVIIDSENPATLRCDSLMIWCINKCTCISMYREVCILYIYIYQFLNHHSLLLFSVFYGSSWLSQPFRQVRSSSCDVSTVLGICQDDLFIASHRLQRYPAGGHGIIRRTDQQQRHSDICQAPRKRRRFTVVTTSCWGVLVSNMVI